MCNSCKVCKIRSVFRISRECKERRVIKKSSMRCL